MMGRVVTADQAYNEDKFTELLLYIAKRLEDDPEGGAVKLNKALWWSECAAMRMYGRSISGAEYQKLEQGPAPRRLLPVRERLVSSGEARLEHSWYMGYRQDRLMVANEPALSLVSAEEKELVDQVLAALKGKNGAELSAESHQEVGWRMVNIGETIPLETAYLAKTTSVTPRMRDHASGSLPLGTALPRRLVTTERRAVRRGKLFLEAALGYFPRGGAPDGRPSFELFEAGPLKGIEELFARSFDELPEAYPGVRAWTTIGVPFFAPMTFYGMLVDDGVELA